MKEIMRATYCGVVRAKLGDRVLVAFETEDDIIEHEYVMEQFIGQHLPEEETRLLVQFSLIEESLPPAPGDDDLIDFRSHRKNVVKGPYTI